MLIIKICKNKLLDRIYYTIIFIFGKEIFFQLGFYFRCFASNQSEHNFILVSDFRENLVSVSSLDKDTQYSTLESKWEVLSTAPALTVSEVEVSIGADVPHSLSQQKLPVPVARTRPQSFAQKLRSTSKSVKGKLGTYCLYSRTLSTLLNIEA